MPKSHASKFKSEEFQAKMLEWYNQNARVLPWRSPKGQKPDPYKVWMSEIMLQQTTVPTVIPYFNKFLEMWPSIQDLASADPDEVMRAWAGLGYYARARNMLKCAVTIVEEYQGKFPDNEENLLKLAGIGPYTAAAITSIAFQKPAIVIDGNIERVGSRVFAIDVPLPQGKTEIRKEAVHLYEAMDRRSGEDISSYPQAFMDLGTAICTPQSPKCSLCPVADFCKAYHLGKPEKFPVKKSKKIVPIRYGSVVVIFTKNDEVVLERRPHNRMLGGMLGLPTTDWDLSGDNKHEELPPILRQLPNSVKIGSIIHIFTHFRLNLDVWGVALADKKLLNQNQNLVYTGYSHIDGIGLPTVFKKALQLAVKEFWREL